jgi:F420-dependent NADP oxidoreductase-like protein
MKIGIIGAGHIGGTLARRLAKLGHQISIANSRGPESLSTLAKETGARAVTVDEAARSGEIVIVTIPMKSVPDLPQSLFERVPAEGHARPHRAAGGGGRSPREGRRHAAGGRARVRPGGRGEPRRVVAAAAGYAGVRGQPGSGRGGAGARRGEGGAAGGVQRWGWGLGAGVIDAWGVSP